MDADFVEMLAGASAADPGKYRQQVTEALMEFARLLRQQRHDFYVTLPWLENIERIVLTTPPKGQRG